MTAPLPAPEGAPTTLAVLRRVRDLLTPPERWMQGSFCREIDDPRHPTRMCLVGAVNFAARGNAAETPAADDGALLALARGLRRDAEHSAAFWLTDWNDELRRTHRAVLRRIDRAIAAEAQS